MAQKRKYWTGAKRAPAQDKFFIEALDPDLWAEGDKNDWNACWHTGMPAAAAFKDAGPQDWINHIPGNNALTVKSLLFKTLLGARARVAGAALKARLSFFPHAYLMPDDYHALQKDAFENPDKRWIVKPKRLSRGRGIAVHDDAGGVPMDAKWLVQDYLADPHLYDGYKYVLRCYLLIRSVDPLEVYLYKDGFVKLASEPYADGDFDNLYAHLTNPDVNALNETVDAPVVFISFEDYRRWLARNGHDADALFERIRDIAALTAVAARETVRAKLAASGADPDACYELIGLDCMVDGALKPWLLECNLSPSLDLCATPENGGDYERRVKRALVRDLVTLLGMNDAGARARREDESSLIARTQAERARAGGFQPVFPARDAGAFLPYLPVPRAYDLALVNAFAATPPDIAFAPSDVCESVFNDGLALYGARADRLYAPDELKSFAWLKACEGAAPDAIASELAALTGADAGAMRRRIWDVFADWGAEGLIGAAGDGAARQAPAPPAEDRESRTDRIAWAGKVVRLDLGAPEIAPRIEPLIAPLRVAGEEKANEIVSFLRDAPGYAIASRTRIIKSRVKLSRLANAFRDFLLAENARAHEASVFLNACACEAERDGAVLFSSSARGGWDGLAVAVAALSDYALRGGATRIVNGAAQALAAPARVAKADFTASCFASAPWRNGKTQEWDQDALGAFVAPAPGAKGVVNPRALIIPVRDQNGGVEVNPLGQRAGLMALDRLRNQCGAPMTAEQARDFADWRRRLAIYEVRFADLESAARQVIALLTTEK